MKCIAAVEVNLDESPIGTRSRASDDLRGTAVLTRTVERIAEAKRIGDVFVLCPPDQVSACARMVPHDLNNRVSVRPIRIPSAPFSSLIQVARKWSLDGSRGGTGGVCSMDEYTRSDELAILAHEQSADALFCASPSAPLLDPALADVMIDHGERTADEARLTFTQAPPGLAGTVYTTDILIEMGRQHVPPGMVMSYKPDTPMMDLAHKSCCYTAREAVRHAAGRLIVDTDRAFQTVHDYLGANRPLDAESVGRWLIERDRTDTPRLPREAEIELTTEDQLSGTLLRPRGNVVGSRGPIEIEVVRRVVEELATFDDSLIVLGGFGEPLLHPHFDQILGIIHDAGIYGVALKTNALALDDARIDAIVRCEVDIVSPLLDAWTTERYHTLHGVDRLQDAMDNVNRLAAVRGQRQCVAPLVIPEIMKSVETVDELDAFFDGWIRETGWANITGYSHHAGQLEDRSVVRMAPPTREPCRQINRRATVLADGRLLTCDQDFTGRSAIGDLHESSLGDLWRGSDMQRLRDRHREGHYDGIPLCARCDEWHRP